MAKRKNNARNADATSANVGYEAQLWQMADALRGSMDAAEYKHVVLGLIFLKYISDAFEEHHAKLVAEQAKGADPEDPDEYLDRRRYPLGRKVSNQEMATLNLTPQPFHGESNYIIRPRKM